MPEVSAHCILRPHPLHMERVEFQVEVPIQASKGSIFSRLNNPSGLSEWFADDVNIKKDVFTFFWMVPRNQPGS